MQVYQGSGIELLSWEEIKEKAVVLGIVMKLKAHRNEYNVIFKPFLCYCPKNMILQTYFQASFSRTDWLILRVMEVNSPGIYNNNHYFERILQITILMFTWIQLAKCGLLIFVVIKPKLQRCESELWVTWVWFLTIKSELHTDSK